MRWAEAPVRHVPVSGFQISTCLTEFASPAAVPVMVPPFASTSPVGRTVRFNQLRRCAIDAVRVTTGVAVVTSTTAASSFATMPSACSFWPPPATRIFPGAYMTCEPDTRGLNGSVPTCFVDPAPSVDSVQMRSPEKPTTPPVGALKARGYHQWLSRAPNRIVLSAPGSCRHAPVPVPISGVVATPAFASGFW